MIFVHIIQTGAIVTSINVQNHADDIAVCNGVSTCITGMCNAFLFPEKYQITLEPGHAHIELKKDTFPCLHDSIVMETFACQVKTLEAHSPDQIHVDVRHSKGDPVKFYEDCFYLKH